jgi:hypothetical protein
MENLQTLINRLKKNNINLELISNYPWIYLCKVNGKQVKEKHLSKYGYTIGFMPFNKNKSFNFTELSQLFKIIRKYL